MLKGQAREDFEKWYNNHIKTYEDTLISGTDIHYFNLLTPSMQHGVLVDWFDSVGIQIYYQCDETIIVFSKGEPIDLPFRQFDTRHQARQKAIEQANTIYNDRK